MNYKNEADALRALIIGFRDEIECRYETEADLVEYPQALTEFALAFFASFDRQQLRVGRTAARRVPDAASI